MITDELRDPYVGPAILKEAGHRYFVGAYLAAALAILLPLLGLALRFRAGRVDSAHV